MICVEVINMGFIPITLSRVVFPLADGTEREFHFKPHALQEQALPVRLEPRESFTVYAEPGIENSPEFITVSSARAWTGCGRSFNGTSPALKIVLKRLRDGSRKK
jgi:hypothetical protein